MWHCHVTLPLLRVVWECRINGVVSGTPGGRAEEQARKVVEDKLNFTFLSLVNQVIMIVIFTLNTEGEEERFISNNYIFHTNKK